MRKPCLRPIPILLHRPYFLAIIGSVIATLVMLPIQDPAFLPSTALLYVLLVVGVAGALGRGPAITAALICSLLYAHVYVPPLFSLNIQEAQYLLAAGIMFVVALVVGQLTAKLQDSARQITTREAQAKALYELARRLTATQTQSEVKLAVAHFLEDALPGGRIRLIDPAEAEPSMLPPHGEIAGHRGQTIVSVGQGREQTRLLVPLVASTGLHGLMICDLSASQASLSATRELLETVASVSAVALERTHFADAARESEVRHSTEILRNSILSALSHDLRTPLTRLIGMADTLASGKLSDERRQGMLENLRSQAMHINRQVTNLLDMARLRSGSVEPARAWQPVEEVIGTTLQQIKEQWKDREITLDIQPALPPVLLDEVLIERVLWNLLENAIKYSPADTPVELSVKRRDPWLDIAICDWGPGLPPGNSEELFGMFRRGQSESSIPGVGLGLAIARTIAEAHGGEVLAENRLGGGASFTLRLPLNAAQLPATPLEDTP